MKIKTECVCPPIPTRKFDWQAWVDGNEEGPNGWGETEQEAVDDLLEKLNVQV
jgi:hypothetical protein